ncbi:hypothetical protein CRM22_000728 [Opisthorchis felineus]|uniref:Uncharacterized protein n=1 Tax=Opisthorchis felineus TaxID=147828 RepID=A0A4S2ME15_OPIFE|nr:hypothetical protein CRM22_000728 [Opisthorchis felineus]
MCLLLPVRLVIGARSYFHSNWVRLPKACSMLLLGKFCCILVLRHIEHFRYGLSQYGTHNRNLFSTNISSTSQTPTVTCRCLLVADITAGLCAPSTTSDLFKRHLCDNLHIRG